MIEERLFPKEVVCDVPRITMVGSENVYVEQHHGLAGFQPDLIVMRTAVGDVHITGNELRFRRYSSCEAEIVGSIMGIAFEQGRKSGAIK